MGVLQATIDHFADLSVARYKQGMDLTPEQNEELVQLSRQQAEIQQQMIMLNSSLFSPSQHHKDMNLFNKCHKDVRHLRSKAPELSEKKLTRSFHHTLAEAKQQQQHTRAVISWMQAASSAKMKAKDFTVAEFYTDAQHNLTKNIWPEAKPLLDDLHDLLDKGERL